MFKIITILSIIIFLTFSCKPGGKEESEIAVARVLDSKLYLSDIKGKIPEGLSENDSLVISRRLIDEWIRNELLLKQAETYLPANEKMIEKQVQEYRSSLLIYIYKQNLISQNLDNNISDEEIVAYYEENSSNYILSGDVIKVNYVKVPLTAAKISEVRIWYKSEREEHLTELQSYCTINEIESIIDGQTWIRFSDLISNTPLKIDNPDRYLNYNKNIESSDSDFHYFIHIIDRIPEGKISPLELVKEDIRSVLMNKRKVEYIQNLENTVYKEGISRNQVEIY